jgi:hypothetical protein
VDSDTARHQYTLVPFALNAIRKTSGACQRFIDYGSQRVEPAGVGRINSIMSQKYRLRAGMSRETWLIRASSSQ